MTNPSAVPQKRRRIRAQDRIDAAFERGVEAQPIVVRGARPSDVVVVTGTWPGGPSADRAATVGEITAEEIERSVSLGCTSAICRDQIATGLLGFGGAGFVWAAIEQRPMRRVLPLIASWRAELHRIARAGAGSVWTTLPSDANRLCRVALRRLGFVTINTTESGAAMYALTIRNA